MPAQRRLRSPPRVSARARHQLPARGRHQLPRSPADRARLLQRRRQRRPLSDHPRRRRGHRRRLAAALIDGLKKKNIRVLGLGVGTTAGTMIPDSAGGVVKDERGAVVLSKLESSTLRELAEKTGGAYADASTWVDLPALLNATIEAGHQGKFHETTRVRFAERFQWALAPALLCLLISFWREFPLRPRARDLKLVSQARRVGPAGQRSEKSRRTLWHNVAIAGLCLLISSLSPLASSLCLRASAAENDNTFADSLTKVVGHLSAQDSTSAHGWGQPRAVHRQLRPAFARHAAARAARPRARRAVRGRRRRSPRCPRGRLAKAPPRTCRPQEKARRTKTATAAAKTTTRSQKNDSGQNQQNSQQNPSSGGKSPGRINRSKTSLRSRTETTPDKNQQNSQPNPSANGHSQQNPSPPLRFATKPATPRPRLAFGDMKEKSPTPAQPRSQPAEARELQKFGGVPENRTGDAAADDPTLVVPLTKLDQLKQQDFPAAIYELLRGENEPAPKPNWKRLVCRTYIFIFIVRFVFCHRRPGAKRPLGSFRRHPRIRPG